MTTGAGEVFLVGAGPGDPGLLTLKGKECLARADLVLYDGLVNPLILRHARGEVERTSRAEGPDGRRLDQAEINRRLIEAAGEGKTVVRLKGGDPFIFGRGAEEADALAAAGIPYEIVPGITAATAAGAYAGIPLTHRSDASAVAFVTGHEDPHKPQSLLDYDALAAFPGTLVFYMGLHRVESICDALISAGKAETTPAAVICRATTPHQRTVTAPLQQLADAVRSAELSPPSLIIVGEAAAHRDRIAWFERRPLLGVRIGITRPEHQAGEAIERCVDLGAEPVLMPTVDILPPSEWTEVDDAIARLSAYDWLIFTSANGVGGFLGRIWETGGDARRMSTLKIAAIGEATAIALAPWGLRADLVPESFRAEELAAALAPLADGRRMLWARADRGRDVLPNQLSAAGATVDQVVVYRNVDVEALPPATVSLLRTRELHWIGLSSPSIARNIARLLEADGIGAAESGVRFAAISPVTAQAAEECGLTVSVTAGDYTWNGILDAIVDASANQGGRLFDSG
ncbi:MAG: uroporphyrinogen-III C-methyltransferase [Planctomycetota bacterium]|nr:MAG: uroporphyrinogen-III C-methyltransferase [Planctomycetota bacterium]REJ91195.1 MAG: uroporphyrinogen-III C-methyltransferase [Planctomycetota bacterium]REK20394.1 MAG: uroporphyrinogen-III C-methyltransferase [Planctomycetota bacterium]REK26891.1 MAG: uroporphyrinogen-III C-methyltransferase [Planctomycetota bacterium]